MGLEKVKERVLDEARQRSAQIVESAKKRASDILASAEKQLRDREASFREQLSGDAAQVRRREAASAKLEGQKLVLSFKKGYVDGLFAEVRARLAELPEGVRAGHVKKLLEKASSELEVGVVYCCKRDVKLVRNFSVKEAGILGGVVAESASGEFRVDYSYDALLEQLKERLLPELNEILFGRVKK
ncbi:hypothetical protein HYU12_00390 [Candidatus Woesearchaeota archaeon]|nr:hypothetical protein [Candidatus Woesearchaeota archaeon]